MASNEKNFKVKLGVTTPKVDYTLNNNVITAEMLDLAIPTLSYSGSAGQLFSISDDLTGTIFSVNDISGIPSIEVNADGTVSIAEFDGNVGIGTSTPLAKLDVNGAIRTNDGVYGSGDLILGANDLPVAYVKTTGELGIGTDLPSNTLDVNGTARVRTISNATGDFATVSATGVIQKRTAAETRTDIGAAASVHTHVISDVTSLQTTLDGKVDENAAITAGTATKITYDAKGLVTAGASLLAGDLPSHTHTKANITDFAHTHPVADVSDSTTVGQNLVKLTNPSAIRFLRVNALNTVDALDAAAFRTAIGAGTSSTTGTVTSVAAGNGLDFTTITASGSVTLGTPGTITGATTNAVTATSHTHALTLAAATFNNGGAGAASGTTFDGTTARTISYNTVGAAGLAAANTFTGATTFNSTVDINAVLSTSSGMRIDGSNTGTANVAWFGFYESNGTTRQGYFGFGSGTDDHLYFYNERPGGDILLNPTSNVVKINSNEVYHAGNLAAQTPNNTAITLVLRDASGSFAAEEVTVDKLRVIMTGSTITNPPIFFDEEPTTGIYRNSGGGLGISVSGSSKLLVNSTQFSVEGAQIVTDVGSAATPTYSFFLDSNTGMFRSGADELGFSVGGTQRLRVTNVAPYVEYYDGLVWQEFGGSGGGDFLPISGGTVTGDIGVNNAFKWFVTSTDTAHQRADARDDATTLSRLHWYGVSATGTTSNFRHAWYDGTAYIDVTAESAIAKFGGSLESSVGYYYGNGTREMIRGVSGDGWLRLNGANAFTSGIYCANSILRTDGQLQVGASGADFLVSGTVVDVPSQIRHTGNVNTYMQFHGTDLWRVVTGGGERIEANNTDGILMAKAKITGTLIIPVL